MANKLFFSKSYFQKLLVSIFAVNAFWGVSISHAQAQPATTQTPPTENAQTYFTRVIRSAPAQLNSCTSDRSLTFDYCGDTFTTNQTVNVPGVPLPEMKPGDKLLCYRVNFNALNFTGDRTPACKYTPSGSADQYIWGGSSLGSTETCTNGQCTSQSAVDRTLAAATNAAADAAKLALEGVASAILTFANFLLAMAGTLLNWVVVKAVFDFGSIMGNSPGLLAAWGILRDIGNMILLFGFIFMGLATILDLHSFPTKKAIPQLLIFAVLMNFSLFAAEAVIDVANTLSVAIYSQANTDPCNGDVTGTVVNTVASAATGKSTDCAVNYGIAGHIMQSTGLSSVFNVPENASLGANTVVVYLGLALFATIGAVVLFAAAIMLAIRLIVLTFLMAASPIGFAGMAIPPLRPFALSWWSKLLHQAFFAPILFLLIFVSLKVTDSFANADTRGSLAGALTQQDSSVMGIIMVFVIVIGFMVASVVIANKFGAAGATGAINFSKKIVLGSLGGTAGAVGRNTIGRGASHLQKRYEGAVGNNAFFRNNVLGVHSLATAGFDAAKSGKYGGSISYDEQKKKSEDRKSHLSHAHEQAALQSRLRTAIDGKNNAEVSRILQQMGASDVEKLEYLKKNTAASEMLARNLSPEKFEAMMKNDKLGADVKENLIHGRFSKFGGAQGYLQTMATGFAPGATPAQLQAAKEAQGEIRKLAPKDLEMMAKYDPNAYNTLIGLQNNEGGSIASDDQFDTLQKSNTLTDIQRQQTKDSSRGKRIEKALDDGDASQAQSIFAAIGGDKNKAKLSPKILTNPEIAEHLTVSELRAIMTEDKLNNKDRAALAKIVRGRVWTETAIRELLTDPFNKALSDYYTP